MTFLVDMIGLISLGVAYRIGCGATTFTNRRK